MSTKRKTKCPVCGESVKLKEGCVASHRDWRTGKKCHGSDVEVTNK